MLLSFGAGSGREAVVKLLLEQGDVSPDWRDESGGTLLSLASGDGHEGAMELPLERGDVNTN